MLLGVLLGLFVLVVLVVLHELGHAIAARRNGVVVEEFGVGFPPRAWSRKLRNGVLFSLNWLPLGGFVKLQGEHDAADGPGDYGAASYWQKTKILLAGVLANWLTAAAILTMLALTGLPKILPGQFSVPSDTTVQAGRTTIAFVNPDSPAAAAGLKQSDELIRFNGRVIQSPNDLIQATKRLKGQKVAIIYKRGGTEYLTSARLRDNNSDGKGFFGVSTTQEERIRTTWSAPIVGVVTTGQFTVETLKGIGQAVSDLAKGLIGKFSGSEAGRQAAKDSLLRAGESVAGPIGILGIIFPSAGKAGLTQVLLLTAVISLSLAVMNILPVPALDGGRWFVMTLFRLLKKPLTKNTEEKIQAAGFFALMSLAVVVTVVDVLRFF